VFWVGIEAEPGLAKLAQEVDHALIPLSVQPEDKPYTPHLTLARAGGSGNPRHLRGDRPNTAFASLQQKLAAMNAPEFGTMMASEFFLYESRLSPAGAQYTKLARFALG
jgi:2'-5' RNA ligase